MKLQKLLLVATAASACAVSAHATPIITPPEIVLTQTSDSALTATYNGNSLNVYEISADNWFVYGFTVLGIDGNGQWTDPDAAGDVNTVGSSLFQTFGLGLLVHADVPFTSGTPLANDTKDTTDFTYFDSSSLPLNVTFNDVVGSTVPDTATTMPLLALAAGGLFGLVRRMRK